MGRLNQDQAAKDRDFRRARGAEAAPEGSPKPAEPCSHAPAGRRAKPLAAGEKHDQLAEKAARAEDRQEALLDEGLEETFPSSDPVSVKRIT